MKQRRYREEVPPELRKAVAWYDEQRPGLGELFFEAVEVTLSRIEENPKQFPVIYRDLRRALLPRPFSYQIFFRIKGEWVEIYAIIHSARDTEVWKRRR